MRWRGRRQSTHIDDRRGTRLRRAGVNGGIGLIAILIVSYFLDIDPRPFLQLLDTQQASAPAPNTTPGPMDEGRQFTAVVLAETEDAWNRLMPQMGRRYQEPTLVLFTGAVQSACGFAQAAVGPFYCPADRQVYIDLSFFEDLGTRFGAGGDFAQAYVIAHEIGHHVQTLIGISGRVRQLKRGASQAEANRLSVRQELQADCFAGIWAHSAERSQILEPGDLEEALNAASAIGDDRLQQRSRGYVTPDSFTHGSAEQRVRWFRRGFTSGNLEDCDTFGTRDL
jgi:predicted metalloprotease